MDIQKIVNQIIQEATSEAGSRGSFISPLKFGMRKFSDTSLEPYWYPVSGYKSPQLEYDSYDGEMSTPKKDIKKIERKAIKSSNNKPKNGFMSKEIKKNKKQINETDTVVTAGLYNGPIEIGLKKWKQHELGPFSIEIDHISNKNSKDKTLRDNIKRIVGMWEKGSDNKYDTPTYDVDTINEDLAVWFGKKKKPKGSKQPKGPWVDICRKVNGKHPPCGRGDADEGSYPKCRAAGVAGKMSDSQKRAACQQKRRAEKMDTQSGKGQKPVMTSYKTKKKSQNENFSINEGNIERIIRKILY
jgi:hypothetical protein